MSLVEVLVAAVVLSLGLLGLAGLQASGIRVAQSSIHRSQAAQFAYDIVERMRANLGQAGDYASESPGGVAETDLKDWRFRLRSLPSGTGKVTVNGSQATVVIQWDDSRGAGVLRESDGDKKAHEALKSSQLQITAQLAN